MGRARKGKLNGLFGEEGVSPPTSADEQTDEPPMAGVFGARSTPLKNSDRKSPADKPAPPAPLEDD